MTPPPELHGCPYALRDAVYQTCPRLVHGIGGEPCEDCPTPTRTRPRGRPPDDLERVLRDADEGELHRLSSFAYMGAFLAARAPFKIVPSDYWESAPGSSVAVINCPCGESRRVEFGAYPAQCQCGRWFFFDGTEVWALRAADAPPS